MKYLAFTLAFTLGVLAASPSMAQVKFEPLTVTEQDMKDLRGYLDEQPMKFGLPILQWLDRLEMRAIQSREDSSKPPVEVKKD